MYLNKLSKNLSHLLHWEEEVSISLHFIISFGNSSSSILGRDETALCVILLSNPVYFVSCCPSLSSDCNSLKAWLRLRHSWKCNVRIGQECSSPSKGLRLALVTVKLVDLIGSPMMCAHMRRNA